MDSVKVVLSKKFRLIYRDYIRGAGLAAGTAVLTLIGTIVESGSFNISWKQVGTAALAACISYLVKNGAIEPSKVITTVHPSEDAESVKNEIKKAVS